MNIHAFAVQCPGAALHPFDYELRELGPHEIDIKVSHCGVYHSDVHLIDNDWNISHYPLVPGHEIIGAVGATGVEVKSLSIGQRVGIGGLGHISLQLAHALDCEVTAFSTNHEKGEDSFAFGADHFVNSGNEKEMQETEAP